MEVENPGKQTTGGPSQWGKEKEKKKKQSRVVSRRKHLFHIRGLSSGDATQSSPPHLVKKKKEEYIHLAAESRQRPSNAAGWESQVQVPSAGVPNEIWLLFFSPAFMVNVTVATHILRFVPWATFSSPGCWISLEVKQTATVGSESFPASSERRNNGWPSAKGLVLGASYVWFVFQFFSCSATRGGVPGSTTDKCLSLHCNCPETPTVLGRHTNKELNDEKKKQPLLLNKIYSVFFISLLLYVYEGSQSSSSS